MKRRTHAVAAVTAALLTVAACSEGGTPPRPTFRASQVSLTPVAERDAVASMAKQTKPLTLPPTALMSESSWAWPRVHADYPVLDSAPALSRRVRARVEAWRTDYTNAVGGTTRADLNITWSAVVNHQGVYGIRLHQTVVAADAQSSTRTLYGHGSQAWSAMDLVRPQARQALTSAILHRAELDAADAATIAPADVLTDITFDADGSMLVTIAEGTIAAASAGSFVARVRHPETILSEAGGEVREAARATPSSTPTSPPVTAAPRPEVDCRTAKCIALTFDDGPGPHTNRLLDVLEREDARATFFMIGTSVAASPATVRRMAALGMGLGDHTWDHPDLANLADEDVTAQITRTADAIRTATGGRAPVAVRPPYGSMRTTTPHAGYPFVLWDVDTEDWRTRNAAQTTKRALSGAHPGAIVLMHDIHGSTVDAVPGIITELKKQGYEFVTVDQLLGPLDEKRTYPARSSTP